MKHKPNSKYYRKKADEAWAKQIRSVGACEICERTTSLNAHHIIARTNLYFRHDLSNGVCLCSHCHKWGDHSPHRDLPSSENFQAWIRFNRPGQWEWYLKNKDCKLRPSWTYKEKYEQLKGTL